MQQNKLTIQIKKPVSEVFTFTITPANTPRWIDSLVIEKTNDWPIHVGTIYRNQNKEGEWSQYSVIAVKENKLFEMVLNDKNYHVRYTYRPIDNNTSELEYYEWVDQGELDDPFTQDVLEKLKFLLESS